MADHWEVWTDLSLKPCHLGSKVMENKKELIEEESKEMINDF